MDSRETSLITADAMARELGVTRRHLGRMVKAGQIQGLMFGKRLMFDLDEVKAQGKRTFSDICGHSEQS